MRIRIEHDLDDLASDCRKVALRVPKDATRIVRDGASFGGKLARENARRSSGKHGKHYPRRITWDRSVGGAFGAYSAEYGPDGHPQGEMSFEHGSRNQPPHHDLARSADVVAPILLGEVRNAVRSYFWAL